MIENEGDIEIDVNLNRLNLRLFVIEHVIVYMAGLENGMRSNSVN